MERLVSVAVSLAFAALIVGVFVLLKRCKVNAKHIIAPCSVVLFLTTFIRYLYKKPALYSVQGLDSAASPFNVPEANPALTALAILLVWFSYAAILSTVMSAFLIIRRFAVSSTCLHFPSLR